MGCFGGIRDSAKGAWGCFGLKMLDEKLCVEGCFDIVLYCQDNKFFTQANGQSVAKTPEGMFDLEIPNDLKFVDKTIREYYGMNKEVEEKE